jgi:hypothetical protein
LLRTPGLVGMLMYAGAIAFVLVIHARYRARDPSPW